MTTIPQDVAAARRRAINSDYFALGYLALSIAAYDAEGDQPPQIIAAITDAVNDKMNGITHWDTNGYWQLEWGPGITLNRWSWRANLIFVASYRDTASKLPIFTAVVIRGTDTSAGVRGLITQLREDLGVHCQKKWGEPIGDTATFTLFGCASREESASSTPYVASGTLLGMRDLLGLTSGGKNVTQFLESFLPQYATTDAPLPVVVTGHSLGGGQVSVVSLSLNSLPSFQSKGAVILPNSFASPMSGNKAFADGLYAATFPQLRRWYNTFDLIPFVFGDLDGIGNLWSKGPYAACSDPIPEDAKILLSLFKNDVHGLQYVHESSGARPFNGRCQPSDGKQPWFSQLGFQHLTPCGYWAPMSSTYKDVLGPMDFPTWTATNPSECWPG
jgi:hypothetical protein